jgi:hypothetical protein
MVKPTTEKLSKQIIKSLLFDIERWGGREACRLSHICNSKQDVYGLPASDARRSVQNKFQRLKTLPNLEYKELLIHYGITNTVEMLDTPATTPPTSDEEGSVNEEPYEPVVTPKSKKADFFKPKTPAAKADKTPSVKTAKANKTSSIPLPTVASSAKKTKPSYPMLTSPKHVHPLVSSEGCLYNGVIDVDTARPECNRETFVFAFSDKPKDGFIHDGMQVVLPVMMPDARHYSAKLVSPFAVEIKYPAWIWLFQEGSAQFDKSLKKYGNYCKRQAEGRKVAKHKANKDEDRFWGRLLLRFPFELDNSIFSEPDHEGNTTIDFVVNPTKYKYKVGDLVFQLQCTTIMWTIAKEGDRRMTVRKKKTTGLDTLFAKHCAIKDDSSSSDEEEEKEEEEEDDDDPY